MFQVERIDHIAFTARNLDGLAEWYKKVFRMERVYADVWADIAKGNPVVLCAGDACVALFQVREGVEPRPVEPRDHNEHFALKLDRANFEQAQRDLWELKIEFRLSNHTVCDSLYFYDPEGHQIELTTYEV